MGSFGDMLLLPWLTRSYRDVLRNVGYALVTEDIFRAQKNCVTIEVVIDLFTKGGVKCSVRAQKRESTDSSWIYQLSLTVQDIASVIPQGDTCLLVEAALWSPLYRLWVACALVAEVCTMSHR